MSPTGDVHGPERVVFKVHECPRVVFGVCVCVCVRSTAAGAHNHVLFTDLLHPLDADHRVSLVVVENSAEGRTLVATVPALADRVADVGTEDAFSAAAPPLHLARTVSGGRCRGGRSGGGGNGGGGDGGGS